MNDEYDPKRFVLGFLFDEARERVVLIWKKRPAWQAGRLNGVGGKVEDGEYFVSAMRREFREETGVDIEEGEWNEFAEIMDGDRALVTCYSATGDVDAVETKTDEIVRWIYARNCLDWNVLPSTRNLILLALDPSQPQASIHYDNPHED